MDDREKTLQMMQRLMKAIKTNDDEIETYIVIPALNYTLGYVLGQALEDGIGMDKLAEVYGQVISEIDYARNTATAVVATYDAIEKARH
jgi:aromatic ring-opening dioxygenase LigB subunit